MKKDIIDESEKCVINLIDDSKLKYWNESKYSDFKEQIRNIVSYENIAKKIVKNKDNVVYNLLENKIHPIYEDLYGCRNRLAHNTLSYQDNLPSFIDMQTEDFGYNNYFVWFYLLIVIDKIMIKLYKEFCENSVELI